MNEVATLVYNTDTHVVFRRLEGQKRILAMRRFDGGDAGKCRNVRVYDLDHPKNFLGKIQKVLDKFEEDHP